MLDKILGMFKLNAYAEMVTIGQIMNAILTTFLADKFTNGESDRNSAIDALIAQLQTHKTIVAVAPPAQQ